MKSTSVVLSEESRYAYIQPSDLAARQWSLHILDSVSGESHSLARHPVLGNHNYEAARTSYRLEVAGDLVGVSVEVDVIYPFPAPGVDHTATLYVYDWKSGELKLVRDPEFPQFSGFNLCHRIAPL